MGKAPGDRTSVVDRVYEQLRQGVGRKWVELLVETWGCLSQEEVCQLLGEVADSSLTAAQKKQVQSYEFVCVWGGGGGEWGLIALMCV